MPNNPLAAAEQATSKMRALLELAATPVQGPEKPVRITALHKLPKDPAERDLFGRKMTAWLVSVFEERLSSQDREVFRCHNLPASMWKQFDEFLIEKAGVFGWTIFLSRLVEGRFFQWLEQEENGPELARRFTDSILRRALIRRGKIKGSIAGREWQDAKKDGVPELRRLRHRYKAESKKRRREMSFTEMCAWYQKTIEDSPKDFPFWWNNLEALLFTMAWLRKNDSTRAQRLALGLEGPATLFDLVAAKSEGLSEHSARRMISETSKL